LFLLLIFMAAGFLPSEPFMVGSARDGGTRNRRVAVAARCAVCSVQCAEGQGGSVTSLELSATATEQE
jgi:hypothetical protein